MDWNSHRIGNREDLSQTVCLGYFGKKLIIKILEHLS